MTAAELKRAVEEAGHSPHYFTRGTMRFFGDTMSNYGVRDGGSIETHSGDVVEVWELYRKRPVREGLQTSAYFDKKTFNRRFPKSGP